MHEYASVLTDPRQRIQNCVVAHRAARPGMTEEQGSNFFRDACGRQRGDSAIGAILFVGMISAEPVQTSAGNQKRWLVSRVDLR